MTFKRQGQRELEYRLILGNILNPLSDERCQWIPDGAMLLAPDKRSSAEYTIKKIGARSQVLRGLDLTDRVMVLDYSNSLIIPSLVDLHFHWVQEDVRQMPKENLLDWLKDFTWPEEKKYQHRSFARRKASEFADKLAQNGTLSGACYGSIHGHTVDLALQKFAGDFVVGNVLMTMNSPEYLSQKPGQAVNLVKTKSARFGERYAVTPRFAPTTHPEVMQAVSKLASNNGSFIQSHLAETRQEIEFVLDIFRRFRGFEKVKSYTEIYQRCGILGPKTIMGHGIYLAPEEWRALAKTKTALAHCPTSNAPIKLKGLGSGLFDFRLANKNKVRWALGSDIGGGPYLSMLDVMQMFVRLNKKNSATYTQALYRATLAGEKILQRDQAQGNFQPGKWANMVVLPLARNWRTQSPEKILQRILSRTKRDEFENLIQVTILRGQEIFFK